MRAVCPGSYDPITLGHLDVITRAAALFDEVIVAVGRNSTKSYLFDAAERLELVTLSCAGLERVRVLPLEGLLVDFCRVHEAGVLVKGVRGASDLDLEWQMAGMNRSLSGVETVLLPAAPQWSYLSSTLVRQVASLGGDVGNYVPDVVAHRLSNRRPAVERP